jgi:large conductance mechanosensitive channel protein
MADKPAKKSRVASAKAKASVAKTRAASAASASRRPASGFMDFVREQGVIGLAVGLAIGTAAGASVKVIVDQFISPLVALLTQGIDLLSLKWVIQHKTASHGEVAIGWGAIVSSLITLLATAFVIYLIIHFAKLDKLDKKKDA